MGHFDIRTHLKGYLLPFQVCNSESAEELRNNLEDEEIREILDAQGFATLPLLKKKDYIASIILRHVLVDSTRSHFEELKEGLKANGVLEAIQAHPEKLRELFTQKDVLPLDSGTMEAIFEIHYAEYGSDQRNHQERTVGYWRDYLQDCESEFSNVSLNSLIPCLIFTILLKIAEYYLDLYMRTVLVFKINFIKTETTACVRMFNAFAPITLSNLRSRLDSNTLCKLLLPFF